MTSSPYLLDSDLALQVIADQTLRIKIYISSLCILLIEYAVTFGREYNLIWKSRWNTVKVLYLLSRYTIFVQVLLMAIFYFTPGLGPAECASLNTAIIASIITVIAVAQAILILRTHALWCRNRTILFYLFALYLMITAAEAPIMFAYSKTIQYLYHLPFGQDIFCSIYREPKALLASWGLVLLLETVIFGMTIYRVKDIRNSHSPLFYTLYTDGILFYAAILGVSLVNIILLAAYPIEVGDTFMALQTMMHSVLSCRVILHLRVAGSEFGYTTSPPLKHFTDPQKVELPMRSQGI